MSKRNEIQFQDIREYPFSARKLEIKSNCDYVRFEFHMLTARRLLHRPFQMFFNGSISSFFQPLDSTLLRNADRTTTHLCCCLTVFTILHHLYPHVRIFCLLSNLLAFFYFSLFFASKRENELENQFKI